MALYVKFECSTCENKNCTGHGLPTTEKVCDGYKHTTTNADCIRAMTDEDLACMFDLLTRTKPETKDDKKLWLDWLKQEVE